MFTQFLIFSLFFTPFIFTAAHDTHDFVRTLDRKMLGLDEKKEKFIHFRLSCVTYTINKCSYGKVNMTLFWIIEIILQICLF